MRLAEDELRARAARIRLAVFDVDGVLTDGQLVFGPGGEEFKVFHVRDGHGLVELKRAGIVIAIITGRSSAAVAARMRELGVEQVHQGVADKLDCLNDVLAATASTAGETLYMGDDLPDLAPMRAVGLPIAVADAVPQVRAAPAWVTRRSGGRGAVREACDLVLAARLAAPADGNHV